jgi:hypothetical protein
LGIITNKNHLSITTIVGLRTRKARKKSSYQDSLGFKSEVMAQAFRLGRDHIHQVLYFEADFLFDGYRVVSL